MKTAIVILIIAATFTYTNAVCSDHAAYDPIQGECQCNGTGWCGTACEYNATGLGTDPNSGNRMLCTNQKNYTGQTLCCRTNRFSFHSNW